MSSSLSIVDSRANCHLIPRSKRMPAFGTLIMRASICKSPLSHWGRPGRGKLRLQAERLGYRGKSPELGSVLGDARCWVLMSTKIPSSPSCECSQLLGSRPFVWNLSSRSTVTGKFSSQSVPEKCKTESALSPGAFTGHPRHGPVSCRSSYMSMSCASLEVQTGQRLTNTCRPSLRPGRTH